MIIYFINAKIKRPTRSKRFRITDAQICQRLHKERLKYYADLKKAINDAIQNKHKNWKVTKVIVYDNIDGQLTIAAIVSSFKHTKIMTIRYERNISTKGNYFVRKNIVTTLTDEATNYKKLTPKNLTLKLEALQP